MRSEAIHLHLDMIQDKLDEQLELVCAMTGDVDALVTLQERLVNLVKQLNVPLIEVSMVIQDMIVPMVDSLIEHAKETNASLPDSIIEKWPIDEIIHVDVESSLAIEKILSVLDQDRMDIITTLIRVTMVETEMILIDAVSSLRMWEHQARTQLSRITSPGQLFSPFELPEDW